MIFDSHEYLKPDKPYFIVFKGEDGVVSYLCLETEEQAIQKAYEIINNGGAIIKAVKIGCYKEIPTIPQIKPITQTDSGNIQITITWQLYTNGDFKLRHRKKYNAIIDSEDDYKYTGEVTFIADKYACRDKAVSYLEDMFCDGIRVVYSSIDVVGQLCGMFDKLIKFLRNGEYGARIETLDGDYKQTKFIVLVQKA